jgi:hypothetical protein
VKRNQVTLAVVAMGAVAALAAGCGGAGAETTTTVLTRRAVTVGAVIAEFTPSGMRDLDSPLLAVEFVVDGTQATAAATAAIFDEVGLGADMLTGEVGVVTWGNEAPKPTPEVLSYLVVVDDAPDTVVVVQSSTGEWTAVSVEG